MFIMNLGPLGKESSNIPTSKLLKSKLESSLWKNKIVKIMNCGRENKVLKLNDLEEWGRLNSWKELRYCVKLFME